MSGFWVVTWQLHCLTRKKIFCFKLCSGNTDTARLTVLESLKWDIAQWKEDSSSWSTLICFHTCLLNVSFVVPFTITYIDFGLYCPVQADIVSNKGQPPECSILIFAKAILRKIFLFHSPPKGGRKLQVYFFKQAKIEQGRMSNLISSLFVAQLMLQISQDYMLFGRHSWAISSFFLAYALISLCTFFLKFYSGVFFFPPKDTHLRAPLILT